MTAVLLDTSVLVQWFHSLGERAVHDARALRDAHVRGDIDVHVLDLAIYEVGNVLGRSLRWDAHDVADQIDDLLAIVGTPLVLESPREAAMLAGRHGLTFSDAAWAAASILHGIPLISADRELLAAGLAEAPSTATARLGLT